MKIISFPKILGLLVILLCLFPSILLAQGFPSNECKTLIGLMDDLLNKTHGWQHQSMLLLWFTIIAGILGLAVSALQGFKNNGSKVATAILGVAISTLTLINTTAFDADHRTLRNNAIQYHADIVDARTQLEIDYDKANEADRKIYRQMVIELIKKVDHAEAQMLAKTATLEILPEVHAAAEQPEWLIKLPTDRFAQYFSGKGEDPSLAVAKDAAYNNAVEGAVRSLGSRSSESTIAPDDPMRKYVVSSSEVDKTYSSYDANRRMYSVYILLKISKTLTRPNTMRAIAR